MGEATFTVQVTAGEASLLKDCVADRRGVDPREEGALDALADRLADALDRGPEAPASSRLGQLWAVFAPTSASTLLDVLWPCTVGSLRQHALGKGEEPLAVFTDQGEARSFAVHHLRRRAAELERLAAAALRQEEST